MDLDSDSENEKKRNFFKNCTQKPAVVKEESIKKGVPKGMKKVKKTRTFMDDKGYLVTEEYSSYDEVQTVAPLVKNESAKIDNTKKKAPLPQAQ